MYLSEPRIQPRIQPVEPKSHWALGLDIGQTRDPCALGLIERRTEGTRSWTIDSSKTQREVPRVRFILKAARRLPLKTPYPRVVDYLRDLRTKPPVDKAKIVVDITGARAFHDMLDAAKIDHVGATLSDAERDKRHPGEEYTVSKANMIGALIAKLEAGELEIADGLQDYEAVEREMTALRKRVSEIGHVAYAAMEGEHDDLVIAIGLGLWLASTGWYDGPSLIPVRGY